MLGIISKIQTRIHEPSQGRRRGKALRRVAFAVVFQGCGISGLQGFAGVFSNFVQSRLVQSKLVHSTFFHLETSVI